MSDNNIALMAHLMRRAGFGVSRDELEQRTEQGYEATCGGNAGYQRCQQYAR